MDKKIAFLAIFLILFCLADLAFGGIQHYGPDSFPQLIENILKAVGQVIASLGTVMIIVAGILYLTSAGDPGRVETAKKALMYAVIGIVIGLAASNIVDIVKGIVS